MHGLWQHVTSPFCGRVIHFTPVTTTVTSVKGSSSNYRTPVPFKVTWTGETPKDGHTPTTDRGGAGVLGSGCQWCPRIVVIRSTCNTWNTYTHGLAVFRIYSVNGSTCLQGRNVQPTVGARLASIGWLFGGRRECAFARCTDGYCPAPSTWVSQCHSRCGFRPRLMPPTFSCDHLIESGACLRQCETWPFA